MYDGRLFLLSGAGEIIPEVPLVSPGLDQDAVLVDLPVRLVGVPVGVVSLRPALLPDEQSCSSPGGGDEIVRTSKPSCSKSDKPSQKSAPFRRNKSSVCCSSAEVTSARYPP